MRTKRKIELRRKRQIERSARLFTPQKMLEFGSGLDLLLVRLNQMNDALSVVAPAMEIVMRNFARL